MFSKFAVGLFVHISVVGFIFQPGFEIRFCMFMCYSRTCSQLCCVRFAPTSLRLRVCNSLCSCACFAILFCDWELQLCFAFALSAQLQLQSVLLQMLGSRSSDKKFWQTKASEEQGSKGFSSPHRQAWEDLRDEMSYENSQTKSFKSPNRRKPKRPPEMKCPTNSYIRNTWEDLTDEKGKKLQQVELATKACTQSP